MLLRTCRDGVQANGKMCCSQPNLWVQPVLALHGERKMPSTCFFALKNIPPWTELTYDYGQQYLEQNLCGDCRCNAATCRRKPDA